MQALCGIIDMQQKNTNINSLVEEQLVAIKNPLVKSALEKMIVLPTPHIRKWDYSNNDEFFECWTIGFDQLTDTSIIYSKHGHGPQNPWGLVATSVMYFGMDTGWFNNLEDCFLESPIASHLPIWFIEKRLENGKSELIAENLTVDAAYKIIEGMSTPNKEYYVQARK